MLNKLNYKILVLLLTLSFSFISCDESGDPMVGGTNLQEVSGDWWVVALQPDGVTAIGDYVQFSTYNTADNDNSLWLDDHKHFATQIRIKTKVLIDLNDKTFVGDANAEELNGGTVTVTEGMITKNSFTTESNTKVDEIIFKVEYSELPGDVYVFKGHRRTGFAEDENPHYSN